MKRLLYLICVGLVSSSSYSAVTIAEYYDNRKMPVVWTSDDMANSGDYEGAGHWDDFIATAELCRDNHMVFTPAIITGRVSSEGWTQLQQAMDAGYLFPAAHTYSHPTFINDYHIQYTVALDRLKSNLVFPESHTYMGDEFNPYYVQWGGAINIDYNITEAYLLTNNLFALRGSTGIVHPYPDWNADSEMFGAIREPTSVWGTNVYWVKTSTGDGDIADGDAIAAFDEAYANGYLFHNYNHAWKPEETPLGTNAATIIAFHEHVGNRHDVWYTTPATELTYRYLYAINPPTITILSEDTASITFKVDGSSLPRAKWGLSVSLAYVVDKPTGWTTNTPYIVEYKDTDGWHAVKRKTAANWYNDGNCYREEGNTIIVNQRLPQDSDVFEIHIREGRKMPSFFKSAGGQ